MAEFRKNLLNAMAPVFPLLRIPRNYKSANFFFSVGVSDIFYFFFSARGRGRGSPRAPGVGGRLFIENPTRGGGVSRRGRGVGRVSERKMAL